MANTDKDFDPNHFGGIIPIFTSIVFIYSCARHYAFYMFGFDINIFEFINVGEILKLIIPEILIFGFIGSSILLFRNLWKAGKSIAIIFGTGVVLVLGFWSLLVPRNYNMPISVFLDSYILLFFIVFIAISAIIFKNTLGFGRIHIIAILLIAVVLLAFNRGSFEARKVLFDPIIGLKIKIKQGSEIFTDNRLIYIGKTEDYIFLFVRSTAKSVIVRMDDVSYLNIPMLKHPWPLFNKSQLIPISQK